MVAVGGLESGAAFEAESVDVSSNGMRLRTAYLPTVGDRLVCRFDGLDGEVLVEGEVIWSTEQQKGGEFALRFVDVDDATREMLKQLCVLEDADEAGAPQKAAESLAGTRVKLHIEGLGSPMKARVRSGDEREMSVGSSLEFLKLGRTVELEDVDRQKRRDGYVDSVKVEIDPQSSVPQLVVSLRFDGVRPDLLATKESARVVMDVSPRTRPGIGPMTPPDASASRSEASEAPGTVRTVAASDSDEDDEMVDFGKSKLRMASEKAKHMTESAVGKVGPALAGFGASAQKVWARVGEGLQRRREKVEETRKANAPRRVTAAAPSGGLKASGKKLVREDDADLEPASSDLPRKNYRKALLGATLGLVVVAGGFGAVRAMSGGDASTKAAPVASAKAPEARDVNPLAANGAATGDVPLFGATPLSTTEMVPPPVPPTAPAKAPKEETADNEDSAKKDVAPLSKQWGHGEVTQKKVLKIKMDGPIVGISGEETEGGFTVTVPGRKSVSSASGLARKDKRLQSVDVTNHEDDAQVAITFKGEVPAFEARAKGDVLEIAVGGSGESKKVASKTSKKKKGSKKAH